MEFERTRFIVRDVRDEVLNECRAEAVARSYAKAEARRTAQPTRVLMVRTDPRGLRRERLVANY
jgi:hypothetical protein